MRELLFLLLVLACPLMMVWMMRGHGGHGSHGGHASHHGRIDGTGVDEPETRSLAELRRWRDALDAEIEQLERSETKTPAGV